MVGNFYNGLFLKINKSNQELNDGSNPGTRNNYKISNTLSLNRHKSSILSLSPSGHLIPRYQIWLSQWHIKERLLNLCFSPLRGCSPGFVSIAPSPKHIWIAIGRLSVKVSGKCYELHQKPTPTVHDKSILINEYLILVTETHKSQDVFFLRTRRVIFCFMHGIVLWARWASTFHMLIDLG